MFNRYVLCVKEGVVNLTRFTIYNAINVEMVEGKTYYGVKNDKGVYTLFLKDNFILMDTLIDNINRGKKGIIYLNDILGCEVPLVLLREITNYIVDNLQNRCDYCTYVNCSEQDDCVEGIMEKLLHK